MGDSLSFNKYKKLLALTLVVGLLTAPLPTGAANTEDEGWRLLKDYGAQEDGGGEPPLAASYRVNRGDTLWAIARRYGVEVSQLIAYNDLKNPNALQPDQTLAIPETGIMAAAAPAGEIGLVPETARYSLVKDLQWPLHGEITSPFGKRGKEYHHGLDIAADTGTDIQAAEDGKVVFAGWKAIYGRTVIIDHGNGIRTVYAHASRILVQAGDRVKVGQVIAKVGATGRATGPHLHFEVHVDGEVINPLDKSNAA